MARMIPPVIHPGCVSYGEQEVFRRLKNDPATSTWIVLHSLDIAEHVRQVSGEADFVVIVPGKGVLCLEVKACSTLRRQGGLWYYGSADKGDARGPFKQASTALHSIRLKLAEKRPDLSRVIFWSAVLFPYVDFAHESPEWHSWQVLDKRDFFSGPLSTHILGILDRARKHLHETRPGWFLRESVEPYPEQCVEIAETLRGDFEFAETSKSQATRLNTELKQFTEEQFLALDSLEANPRITFTGPAGTGKTFLAIEAARRGQIAGRRVLFLCFNRFLGMWLQRQVAPFPGIKACTIHSFLLDRADSKPPTSADSVFWENVLPAMALENATKDVSDKNTYDELIIDEAQDLLIPEYLDVIDLALKGGLAAGRWRIFGDFEGQRIYGTSGMTLEEFCEVRSSGSARFSLQVNCRNTPRVAFWAQTVGGLTPPYSGCRRSDDGIEPEFISYADMSDQVSKLEDVLEKLGKSGLKGQDIIVLSSRTSLSSAASQIASQPWKDKLSPFSGESTGHVSYCTVQAFKGLEAQAVIVTDVEDPIDDSTQRILYIAITRALRKLVILGNERIKSQLVETILKAKP